MSDQPSSPFSGLDKALLRSTQTQQTEAAPTAPAHQDNRHDVPPPRSMKQAKSSRAAPRPRAATAVALVDPVDALQQNLKTIGKEIYYVRITPEEKAKIEDVLHALKRRGMRTSANELGRIALNQLLADYETQGEESMLVRVLSRMRA
jgi:hypothetical protein